MNAPLAAVSLSATAGVERGWRAWNDHELGHRLARLKLVLAARVAGGSAAPPDYAAQLAEHETAQEEARQALSAQRQMTAAAAIVQRCGLSGFEAEVLLLCLAPEADHEIAALLTRAGGVAGRPTPGLAAALAGVSLPSAMLAFAAPSPLLALRLVEIEAGPPLAVAPMRLAPRVRDFLLGLDRLDTEAAFLSPMPRCSLSGALRLAARRAARGFVGGAGVVALIGPPASGGLAVAAEAAVLAGHVPMLLDPARLPDNAALRDAALALLARECALSRLMIVIDTTTEKLPATLHPRLIEHPPGPLVILGIDRAGLPAAATVLDLPRSDMAARAALWRAAVPRLKPAVAGRMAAQFMLAPEAVTRVAAASGSPDALWQRARDEAAPALSELGQRIIPRATFSDLVLPPDALAALRDVAAAARVRDIVDGAWGFVHDGGRGEGIALLLSGPSGTGKTLAAEVLAGELGLDLFRIDLSGVVSKWIGETEKNLRRVFDAAEAGGAVLFFDEADALFGKRTEVKDSHDRHANVEIGYLLQRMEAYRGLSVLATNLRGNLDQAFLRRIRYAIDLPFPDEAARRAIWARHIPARAPVGALDLDELARLDLPGGAIRTVALNGAAMAAAEGSAIETRHMQAAARRELAKLGRLAPARPR